MSYTIPMSPTSEESTEHETMLEAASDRGIFSVTRDGDGFKIMEECDYCFKMHVTPDQLRALGQELIDVADGKTQVESYG